MSDRQPTTHADLVRQGKHTQALARREEEGFQKCLDEFIPSVIETVKKTQEIGPKLLEAIDKAIGNDKEPANTEALKNLAPMAKLIFDENKRILDRKFGTSVKREESTVHKTVTHVRLSDLLNARNPSPPPVTIEATVTKSADQEN